MSGHWFFHPLEPRQLLASSVEGFIFNDVNADRVRQSAEPGLPSVRVYLDANNNRRIDAGERSTFTAPNGHYWFGHVHAGKYIVRQVVKAGWRQTTPHKGFGWHVNVGKSTDVDDADFGQTFATQFWSGFAENPQHTAISSVAAQALEKIHWQTKVDLMPEFESDELLIHYGSPLVTPNNTIIIPVKLHADGGFRIDARRGSDGKLLWSVNTDYVLPPGFQIQSYSPALAANGRLYFAGAGGTVLWVDHVDDAGAKTVHRTAFYNVHKFNANKAGFTSTIFVDTPLTIDKSGNIFFGVELDDTVEPGNPLDLPTGGLARIDGKTGAGSFISATDATGDSVVRKVAHDSAPALSNDGRTVYVAIDKTIRVGQGAGIISGNFLVALDAATLAVKKSVRLFDPLTGQDSSVADGGTASPMVGPDGDVYFGVVDSPPMNHFRGWMMHFNSALTQQKTTGAFGWDDTPSVVPAGLVKSYHGTSKYLLMTKYNDYAGLGGDGVNKIAILDPNASHVDPATGVRVMNEVLAIAGVTPDPDHFPEFPRAVKEWCINTSVVDPATHSVLANSEDGVLYRWDLWTNKLTQRIRLTPGIGESYTPTLIGGDGTVYAINDATLFAVGEATA
jgi:hypothetical protein